MSDSVKSVKMQRLSAAAQAHYGMCLAEKLAMMRVIKS